MTHAAAAALGVLAMAVLLWPSHSHPIGRGPDRVGFRERLAALEVPEHPGRWIVGVAAVCAAAVAFIAPWHAAISAGVLSAIAASSWAQGRRRRADALMLSRDVETLQAIGAELRAGNDLAAALRSAGTVADTRMCAALTRAAQAIRMGDDPGAALERTAVSGVHRLAGLVRLSGSAGIALAEAVEVLADDATTQAHVRRDVTSLLAGPRATAALLTMLPAFGIVMGQTIGADPWRVLMHTNAGAIAMLVGTVLAAAGVWWTNAMVNGAQR
ncbi:MAG: type II secretion system F family protein [Cumulibacter sp.]